MVYLTHLWAVLFLYSQHVWSLTMLAWESVRFGLGSDMDAIVIVKTLSPICVLSVVGYYFPFVVLWIFVMYQLSLDSLESFLYIYISLLLLLRILSWTVLMVSHFHPHNAHVSACTLCLVGILRSLLCRFDRIAKICIVPILGRHKPFGNISEWILARTR